MPTTFRQNLRSGLYQLLTGWLAEGSNSALVRQVYDHRPPTFDPPVAFVGSFVETVNHSGQVRQRQVDAQVVVIRASYDNAEQLRLSDVVLDSLEDYLSARWHGLTALTLQEPVSSVDQPMEIGGVPYFATVLTVRGMIQEGRP
jgi:hypothetical protein